MGSLPLLDELQARGLLHDTTERAELAARLSARLITLYYGCDPSADSLHVGNLVGLVTLRRFQLRGHHPIALVGGATGMIGDPSGRSSERNLLDPETLEANIASIKAQITRILGEGRWSLTDNSDWTSELHFLEFLREVGKHFTINAMIAKESVKARMQSDEGISYTEFSYMLLQAYDYLALYQRQGCELQIGGSDQWGNITAGIDLVRRKHRVHVHGLTWPLLTRSDGKKFGKSEGDNPWLSPHRTSPYRFYQYWMNVPDADVGGFLRKFTFLSLEEIAALEAQAFEAPERREAQRALAREVTAMVHGEAAAAAAAEASELLFGGAVETASPRALAFVATEVPLTVVGRDRLCSGVDLAELLAETGLAASRSDARRQVAQGAAYVNNRRGEEGRVVNGRDLLYGRYLLLRRGKREYHVVEAG